MDKGRTDLGGTFEGNGSVVLVAGDDGPAEVDDGESVVLHAAHVRHLEEELDHQQPQH